MSLEITTYIMGLKYKLIISFIMIMVCFDFVKYFYVIWLFVVGDLMCNGGKLKKDLYLKLLLVHSSKALMASLFFDNEGRLIKQNSYWLMNIKMIKK